MKNCKKIPLRFLGTGLKITSVKSELFADSPTDKAFDFDSGFQFLQRALGFRLTNQPKNNIVFMLFSFYIFKTPQNC